jgi:hypothetical protein
VSRRRPRVSARCTIGSAPLVALGVEVEASEPVIAEQAVHDGLVTPDTDINRVAESKKGCSRPRRSIAPTTTPGFTQRSRRADHRSAGVIANITSILTIDIHRRIGSVDVSSIRPAT